MRKLIIIFILTFAVSLGFTQTKEVKLATKLTYGLSAGLSDRGGVLLNYYSVNLGFNFKNKNTDSYLYLLFMHNTNSVYRKIHSELDWPLYKGYYIGLTFENHFLSKEKRFRPYFGLSFMTEVATNYKEGFLSAAIDNETSFLPRDNYSLYSTFYYYYYYDTYHSGFYYSTPLFGTASLGFDVRLIKDLHLNFSLGYGLQLMRYKYFKWKSYEDYRELLKSRPMKSRKLHYVNAELGLRYEFSFKKESKPQ